MREIKFKAFDDVLLKIFGPLTLKEIADNNFGITNWNQLKLMQYTGLKDKNGKEIYEGDIALDSHYETVGKIVFDEGKFLYEWENISEDLFEACGEIEVVGNVYEDLELGVER